MRALAFAAALALCFAPASAIVAPTMPALAGLGAEPTPGATVARALTTAAQAAGLLRIPPLRCAVLEDALDAHAARLGIPTPTVPASWADAQRRALGCVLGALAEANAAHDALIEGVPRDVLARLMRSEDAPDPDDLAWLRGRSAHGNLVAAVHLAQAVDLLLDELTKSAAPGEPLDLEPILRFEPDGAQTYTDNYALILDLEGDDTYDNHAGGIFLAAGRAFFDVEEGSAWHEGSAGGQSFAVGGGVQDGDFAFSAGLVIDFAGNDTYGVKHAPILGDARANCGTEARVAYVGTIGAGILGVGMLFDLAGDNTYTGRTQSQGAGHVFGVGAVYTGPGRDRHEAIRGAQGSGLLGGHGVLVDAGGDDEYVLAAPQGGVFNGDRRFCDADARYGQGGNFDRKDGPFAPAVGILLELGGSDLYRSPHKSQGFSQGHGFGLLLDASGDDRYESSGLAQGAGFGRAVEFDPQAIWGGGAGLLLDHAGNDTYTATTQAQGWALGTGLDGAPGTGSDLDTILLWSVRRNEALGLLWDASGTDLYGAAGRADGQAGSEGALGVWADLE